jgi:hypothetical protein
MFFPVLVRVAHLDTAPGARPSGRFNVRPFAAETIGLWVGER